MLPGRTHQNLQREPQLRAAAAAVIYRRGDSCWLPALVVHQPNQLCRLDLLPGILPAPAAPMPGCTQARPGPAGIALAGHVAGPGSIPNSLQKPVWYWPARWQAQTAPLTTGLAGRHQQQRQQLEPDGPYSVVILPGRHSFDCRACLSIRQRTSSTSCPPSWSSLASRLLLATSWVGPLLSSGTIRCGSRGKGPGLRPHTTNTCSSDSGQAI